MKRRDQKQQQPTSVTPLPPPGAPGESIVWRFVAIYLSLVLLGFIVFRHPSTMVGGNEMSVDRAMFTSVNVVTLTGFQQTLATDEYRLPGKLAALLLMMASTLTTLTASGMAASRIARLGWSGRTILVAAVTAELAVVALGALALPGRGRDAFAAIFQAASAFGNGGLHLGALPAADDPRTHLVLMPLSVLGAIGIPLLLTLGVSLRRQTPLPAYARLALMLLAGSYAIGLLTLALMNGDHGWRDTLTTASVQSINSRTTGFPFAIGDGRPGHWVLIVLMAAGGISGAAAGGVKLTTLWSVFTGARAAMRGRAPGRVFAIALTWLGVYALLVFVALLALLATDPGQPADRLLFLVVSAVSNVGLAHNPVSIVGPGMFVLSAAMLLGRVLPLAILWWVVATATDETAIPIG